jgi:hypothetical protein
MAQMAKSKDRSPCWALQQASLVCLTDLKRLSGSETTVAAVVCDEQVRDYKRCLKEQQALKTAKRNDAFFGRSAPDAEETADARRNK